MKKEICVIFNTDQLGGGERSLVEQFSLVKDQYDLKMFIPELKNNSQLTEFLLAKGFNQTYPYRYPRFFYELSRKDYYKLPLILIQFPLLISYLYSWNKSFKKFSNFYINGNKAAFPVFVWSTFFRKKNVMFWHFRDYPSPFAFTVIKKLINIFLKHINLTLISNSFSVAQEIKKLLPHFENATIYNLAGNLEKNRTISSIKTIGVVSMLAPWKGIHEVITMAALFENELKNIGIQKISIYGDNIYLTRGDHHNYYQDIIKLKEKLKANLICFEGKDSPESIFSKIDLLIHSSIKPEPFGRVIIEAQKSGIPVISSGLGGASELVKNNTCGLSYVSHDYKDLFLRIRETVLNEAERELRIENALKNVTKMEIEIQTTLIHLFDKIM